MTDQPTNESQPDSEMVPTDDAIIGHAFRWSAMAIVGIALGVLGVMYVLRDEKAQDEEVIKKDFTEVTPLLSGAALMPVVRFTDITTEAGINFVHTNGARGEKLLPETMGGGCAFFDYDGDGDQDLLLVNSAPWPHDNSDEPAPTMALYQNDGTGHFKDVTVEAGLNVTFYGMGAATGDFDNDGDVDLYITAVGKNHFFRNDGGVFIDTTSQSGVAGDEAGWSTSAGFFDYDNDGDLDLFVCNYVKWTRDIDIQLHFTLNGTDRAYGPPIQYVGSAPSLYRNNGDGTFSDVSVEAGMIVTSTTGSLVAKSLATTFVDVDRDGDLDILVANDTTRNFLYRNNGDGTFTEDGSSSGMAYDPMGSATGAMGIDVSHYLNDNALAIAIGNFANEPTSFFVMQSGSNYFADESSSNGVGSPSRSKLSFGLFFFDYDLDGRLDMLQVNGHLEEAINEIQSSQHYRQPAQLFWNAGIEARLPLAVVSDGTVGDLALPIVGRAAAYADIDDDGDLDVLLTQSGGAPMLLRNDQNLNHRWLRVKLIGTASNRDAIGAWVELTAGDVTQRRQVMPTRSYLTQVELPVTFGLDTQDRIDSLRIIWPDGSKQTISDVEIDSMLTVRQPER